MTKQLNIDIIARDKTKQALTGVQSRLNQVKSSVFSLRGALVGLGAGAVIRSFVNVGKEVESLQIRFKFLFGSVDEGSKAFDNLTKFAGKVPFSLEQITRASGNLAVVAKDAEDLNRILEITGNVAAVTGLDFETTASQIQRAFSGGIAAADIFREKGIRSLLGFQQGAKVSVEETVAAFEAAFSGNGRFAQATNDLAQTLEGTISMIGDKYFNFQKDVAEGFFEELKKEFGDLNKFLEENEQQIEDIATAIGQNFAGALTRASETIKAIAPAIKNISDALGTTIQGFASLPPFVQNVGLIGALLFGKKGAIAVGAISFLVGQIDELFEKAKDISKLADIDFAKSTNLDELNLQLEILKKNRDDIIGQMNNDESLIPLETTLEELNEANAAIKNIQDRIDTLTAAEKLEKVSVETKHLSHNLEELVGITEMGSTHAEAFGNAYMKSVHLAVKTFVEGEDAMTDAALKSLEEQERILNQKLENERRFLDELKKGRAREIVFEEMTQEKKREILIGAGKDILGNLATFNKKAFRLNQALAIGDAIMSTAQGVAAGLKKGFPVGYIEAAITAARGAAQIAAIRSAPPPRALGGSVTAGQPYIVGEQGREMFVPNQSGTIVSNDNLNKGTVVNVNIMANDTQGFDDLLIKRRSTIINVINDALNSQGREALV
jgi:3-methyladenine DNA glycosylase Tag